MSVERDIADSSYEPQSEPQLDVATKAAGFVKW